MHYACYKFHGIHHTSHSVYTELFFQGKFVLLCSLVDLSEEEEDYAELDEKPESYDLIFMIPVHVQTGATFRIAWRKCTLERSMAF